MLNAVVKKLRQFLRSELDLSKDRMIQEMRKEFVSADSSIAGLQKLGWYYEGDRPFERIVGFGIHFDPVRHAHWIASMQWVGLLVRDCGATLHLDANGDIEIRIGAVRLVPETPQEMAFLMELFHDEGYSVECNTPMYVWDIGANVGFASCYFAGMRGWDVAAYELCPPTAESARKNIALSGLESKIQLNAFGVGGKNETMKIAFSPITRGSNGILGNISWDELGEEEQLEVEVRDAAEVIDDVVKQAGGRPILAKMDCEGAEYALLERLVETGKLRHITAMILEAHVHPGLAPDDAVTTLLKGGFVVRRKRRLTDRSAIIYATRLGG